MSASFATLPNRRAPAGDASGHRPLSAIAAAASGGVPQARIRRVLADLAGPLAELHSQGRVHGAIAMSTVGLDSAGKAHLLVPPLEPAADAEGGARLEGYAAFEQYTDDPERPCGPWTDIYALSAVAHAMLVGAAPPAALARCVKDTYAPLAGRELGAYDRTFLQAVDRGLSMKHSARPQDMDAFEQAFGLVVQEAPPPAEPPALPAAPEPALPPVAAAAKPAPGPRVPLLVLLGVLAAVAFAVYLWLRHEAAGTQSAGREPPPEPTPPAVAPAPEPVPTPPALSDLGTPRAAAPPAASPAPAMPQAPDPATAPAQPPAVQAPPEAATPPAESLSASPAQPSADASPAAPSGTNPSAGAPADPAAAPETGPDASPAATANPPADLAADPAAAVAAGEGAAAEGAEAAEAQAGETPPEEPPATSVVVRVHVQPWGEVLIDGRSRGISPPLTELTLAPGRHRVTIRNPAAPDYETSVNVSPGGSASISHVFE